MSLAIARTVTASELRDPDVLAEAGRGPIGVYDGRRQESLVLTSRSAFDTDQELHRYMSLLAHCVVELARPDPSPAALGEAGYVAGWMPADRAWWLRGLAEAVGVAVTEQTAEPIAGFIRAAGNASSAPASPLERPIDGAKFRTDIAAKLVPRNS
jgi:hypothetical protein